MQLSHIRWDATKTKLSRRVAIVVAAVVGLSLVAICQLSNSLEEQKLMGVWHVEGNDVRSVFVFLSNGTTTEVGSHEGSFVKSHSKTRWCIHGSRLYYTDSAILDSGIERRDALKVVRRWLHLSHDYYWEIRTESVDKVELTNEYGDRQRLRRATDPHLLELYNDMEDAL